MRSQDLLVLGQAHVNVRRCDFDCFGCVRRGFTKFSRTDYLKWKEENRIVNDGVNAKVGLGTSTSFL